MDHPSQIGKYAIEKFLGGGMSNVYRAKDTVLGRRVALKILTSAGAADEESKTRFLLEARMASNIVHENIISIYDFGEAEGRPFIVMEYLEGESLRAAIRHGRTGDMAHRMKIALQIARAVDYIHSKKVIHRDIKPENIHVEPSGKVKMMDFGIAKVDGMQLTRAGFTLGTPYYMAPEQVLGKTLTPQADVYAFGVMLFELISGTRAVSGDKVERIFENILHQPLDMAPLQAAGAPETVINLIARCTAKPPAQRPHGLGAVAEEIENMFGTRGDPPAQRQFARIATPAALPNEGARDSRAELASLPASLSASLSALPPASSPVTFPATGPITGHASRPDSALAGLPPWLESRMERLPPKLRTQGALMAMAGGVVFMGFMLIYVVLALAHVV
jgi:serine/threonine protein kinase